MRPLRHQDRTPRRRIGHRFAAVLIAAALAASAPSAAFAQEGDAPAVEAEKRSKRGVELYKAGKFPEAVREMVAAYQLVPDPGLLYNIGRIYQKMEEWDLALQYYKRYASHEEANPDLVAKALQHIKEVRDVTSSPRLPTADLEGDEGEGDEAETEGGDAGSPGKGDGEGPAEVANTGEGDDKGDPIEGPPPVEATPAPDHTLEWVLIGSGATVAVLSGGIFGGLAWAADEDVADLEMDYDARLSRQEDGELWALLADIGVGAGLVTASVGLGMYLFGGQEEPAASEVRISPTLTAGGAGASIVIPIR